MCVKFYCATLNCRQTDSMYYRKIEENISPFIGTTPGKLAV